MLPVAPTRWTYFATFTATRCAIAFTWITLAVSTSTLLILALSIFSFCSFHKKKLKNKVICIYFYFLVAVSQVRRSSSIKASTTRTSGDESFSRPQHWRWSRMSSRFADLRSHIAALIWWAISAQYVPSSAISMIVSRLQRAFLSDVIMLFLLCVIYHTIGYGYKYMDKIIKARENCIFS